MSDTLSEVLKTPAHVFWNDLADLALQDCRANRKRRDFHRAFDALDRCREYRETARRHLPEQLEAAE